MAMKFGMPSLVVLVEPNKKLFQYVWIVGSYMIRIKANVLFVPLFLVRF